MLGIGDWLLLPIACHTQAGTPPEWQVAGVTAQRDQCLCLASGFLGYAVLITLRAVDSDLEFAVSKVADLPDEGRAYVEHVTTPDPLRARSGGSTTWSQRAMACVSAHRAKRTYRSPARATNRNGASVPPTEPAATDQPAR